MHYWLQARTLNELADTSTLTLKLTIGQYLLEPLHYHPSVEQQIVNKLSVNIRILHNRLNQTNAQIPPNERRISLISRHYRYVAMSPSLMSQAFNDGLVAAELQTGRTQVATST